MYMYIIKIQVRKGGGSIRDVQQGNKKEREEREGEMETYRIRIKVREGGERGGLAVDEEEEVQLTVTRDSHQNIGHRNIDKVLCWSREMTEMTGMPRNASTKCSALARLEIRSK
jgi:hypothetical protein